MRCARLGLWLAPLTLAGGCLLPSFENVQKQVAPSGGTSPGGAPSSEGGQGGSDAGAGGALAGAGGSAEPLQLEPDRYVVAQGEELTVPARLGVLANDAPSGMSVASFEAAPSERPPELDAELEITADGSLTFRPAPEFFGRYEVQYVARSEEREASSVVTFIVQPASVSVEQVRSGVGGVLLTGAPDDEIGTALAALGDVNLDGFDDFAVGAPGATHGAVYVVFGGPVLSDLQLMRTVTEKDEARFAVLAGSAGDGVGRHVAGLGAFDGDVAPDLLVGAPQRSSGDGALYVVSGGADLVGTRLLEQVGAKMVGEPFLAQRLGSVVAGGGDFDGDGQRDLLAGLYPTGSAEKALAIVNGWSANVTQASRATVSDDLNGLPTSAAFVGDLDGDGNDEVMASSDQAIALLLGDASGSAVPALADLVPRFRLSRPAGAQGDAPVASAGDVNGDGNLDVIYCDQVAGAASCSVLFGKLSAAASLASADWELTGFGSATGPLLASGADLNDDGYADLLVADATSGYVVFGRRSGFGVVNLASLGSDGFALSGASGLSAIATIGDVNGDGYGDFALGDAAAAGGAGAVYVVLGGPYALEQR